MKYNNRREGHKMNPALPRFLITGVLTRDYVILPSGETLLDVPGGNALYAGVGLLLWEPDPPPALIARVGEDYPQAWIDELEQTGFIEGDVRSKAGPVIRFEQITAVRFAVPIKAAVATAITQRPDQGAADLFLNDGLKNRFNRISRDKTEFTDKVRLFTASPGCISFNLVNSLIGIF